MQATELSKEFGASFGDQPAQFALVIGEVQKWRRGGEFLPLEQQWDAGRE